MEGHHLYSEAAETGVAPAELAAVAEELAKTSSKVLWKKLFVFCFDFVLNFSHELLGYLSVM